MPAVQDSAVAIRVLSSAHDDDWTFAELLIAELKEWDLQQSRALEFEDHEVIEVFYPDDIEQIRRQSALPDGCFAIAMDASVPAACAGFRRLSAGKCELYDVYVRPSYRRRGIGSSLVQRLLRQAGAAGYEAMCLETASFMLTAHNLYRSLHFQVREPYRAIPARLAEVTLWMECRLEG